MYGYAQGSVNPETFKKWSKGVELYHEYCALNDGLCGGVPEYPTAETLAGFATWLVDYKNKSPKGIRQFLLGVARWTQSHEPSRGDPRLDRGGRMTFLLYSTLRGISRAHSRKKPPREALTTDKLNVILERLLSLPSAEMPAGDRAMFAALLALGVYGLCRCGELTSPTTKTTSQASPTLGDVHLYRNPQGEATHFDFTIRGSKTDVFRAGTRVVVYATGTLFCPVKLMARYLAGTRTQPLGSPLFTRMDGRYVTRDHVNRLIKSMATAAGFEPRRFSTHSMRAGGATTLSLLGYPPAVIQQLGRWTSDAYLAYIRLPEDQHREAMTRMAKLPPSTVGARAATARARNAAWIGLRSAL